MNIFSFLHFWKKINILKSRIYNYIILPKNHMTILEKKSKFNPFQIKKTIDSDKKNKKNKNFLINENIILNQKNSNYESINKFVSSSTKLYNMSENISSDRNFLKKIKDIYFNQKEIIKPKTIKEKEIEYEEMNFYDAKYKDKRNLWFIIYSFFFSKISLIKIFFYPNEFEIFYITFSSFLFGIIVDFSINALLFSDVILTEKYKSGNNQLSFITNECLSIISDLVGSLFCNYMFKLINYSYALELIKKEVKNNKEIVNVYKEFEKIITFRLFIYFILQFLFMIGFMYYIIIFCTLYKYSQSALFKSYIIGLITHIIYSFVISIVISILRYISLRCSSKKVFLFSQFLNELF
jgi:hypothetical protein